MRKAVLLLGLATLVVGSGIDVVNATGSGPLKFTVVPFEFDPHNTHLVSAQWKGGTGCPLNARTAPFLPPNFDTVGTGMFTDPACITGDAWDKYVHGLVLVKTGPTNNNASAGATLNGVYGVSLQELGYDIRKPGLAVDPRGSHCGAGAPRFNIATTDGSSYFIGCNSPPADSETPGTGWLRLRWGGLFPLMAFNADTFTLDDITGKTVKSISILFDEGQDVSGGPDQFGAAILDNIEVNGVMVGRGPNKPHENDRDECNGKDKDHRHFSGYSSKSRPEESNLSFTDPGAGVYVQMINGAKSVSYAGACVTTVGDALFNDEPGHTVTFTACDLSALSTPLTPKIGTYSITVANASGVVYQQANALTSGNVTIHR
jgi:hypothetical protein